MYPQRTLAQVGLGLVSVLVGLSVLTPGQALGGRSYSHPDGQRAGVRALAQVAQLDALPDRKPTTVMVEGEPQQVTLQLYAHPDMPLVTYYPPAMTTAEICGEDGCWITFRHEDLGAAVLFLFPRDAVSVTQVEPYITGAQGLLSDASWMVTGEFVEPQDLRFPWAKKAIRFQSETRDVVGIVYLGEIDGSAFAVVEVFPPDAGDGFVPQANAILSEMRLRE